MHTRAHTPSASASASLVAPRADELEASPSSLAHGMDRGESLAQGALRGAASATAAKVRADIASLPPSLKQASKPQQARAAQRSARKQSPLSLASLALTCPCSLHRHMRMRRKCWRSMPSPTTARRTMMLPPSASLPALPVTEPRAARSTGSVVDDGPIHRHSDRRCSASAHQPSSSQPRCDPQCREARPRAHGMSLAHR